MKPINLLHSKIFTNLKSKAMAQQRSSKIVPIPCNFRFSHIFNVKRTTINALYGAASCGMLSLIVSGRQIGYRGANQLPQASILDVRMIFICMLLC